MSIRVYEIITAGALQGYLARVLAKMAQRRRISRFCQFKGIDYRPSSIICNNYSHDLQKVCTLYRMGYADAIIIAGMEGWAESEKEYFKKMKNANKVKVINLDDMDGVIS